MAYVLGFFAADGSMVSTKRGTHFISIHSVDRDILVKMKGVMKAEHKISARISETGCVYRIQVGSKEMFKDLEELGFMQRKTNRMSIPTMPRNMFKHFVRGYFDGDG